MDQTSTGSVPSFPKRERRRDVFLSHASEDVEIARRLCTALEQSGWSVFLAARDLPGELNAADWSQRIDEALDGCGVLVLIAPPEALTKRWVTYEWRSIHDDILADKGGWLVPCCVRELAPDQLGRALRRYQIVDLRTSKDWEPGFANLVAIIEGYLKRPIAHLESAMRSVLTIGGAGLRRFLVVPVLERLELALLQGGGQCLADHFDLIVGNSVGAQFAAILALGVRVARCANEITKALFSSFRQRRLSMYLFPRVSSAKLVASLSDVFGDRGLSTAPKCAISTFDLSIGEHRLWSCHPALGGTETSPSLASLTAASIAAPGIFDPVHVVNNDGTCHLLLDGALWEADPERVGLEAVRRLFSPSPLIGDVVLVSVGSGRLPNAVAAEKAPDLLHWAILLPSVLMTASRQLVHEHVERLYRDAGALENYLRF